MNFEKSNFAEEVYEEVYIDDYQDNLELQSLLKQLPKELVARHIEKIEKNRLSEEESVSYLKEVLKKREEATRISVVSDEGIREHFVGQEEEIFRQIEGSIFTSTNNLLGTGMTARVKGYVFETAAIQVPMAVKYIVTPTAKTLTAEAEHGVISEVERMLEVESREKKDSEKLKHIRVPHPYFHHKNERIQCYGMELIPGVTLDQAINGQWHYPEEKEEIKKSLENTSLETLFSEVEIFYENMHDYCLHGDMKPGNLMISHDGTFFVIDFGQSILTTNISDKEREQFETLKEDEIKQTKDAIRYLYTSLFK